MKIVAMASNDPLENNFLAQMSTWPLLLLFTATILVAFGIARYYKNEYNSKKMLQAYGMVSIIITLTGLVIQLKIALLVGILLAGLVSLIFRSNVYFYEK
ncbi:hypothetical protein [Carnobacterium maltaromaticum]|uniref:hypothetical protein n=1 Tax=Carnobacterium maltaromaticum TaxID=2751 RepID=UPI00295E4E37|nr:hypothetical protein [Carnobacterium maltaromaticum]